MDWRVDDEDVGYLRFGRSDARSVIQKIIELPRGTLVIDLDRNSKVIGIEVVGAHSLLPEEEFEDASD